MGAVPGALGGLNLGGLDVSTMLSNPALMNMVCMCCARYSRYLFGSPLILLLERQSARMSKITNDGLTRSGTGCFIAVLIWQQ